MDGTADRSVKRSIGSGHCHIVLTVLLSHPKTPLWTNSHNNTSRPVAPLLEARWADALSWEIAAGVLAPAPEAAIERRWSGSC